MLNRRVRAKAATELRAILDRTAEHAKDIPESEIEVGLDEALDGQASVLSSRDAHRLDSRVQPWCRGRGIEVVNALELLRLLREGESAG